MIRNMSIIGKANAAGKLALQVGINQKVSFGNPTGGCPTGLFSGFQVPH